MNSWDDLRFFLAVARAGGLSAAAKQLAVEPSTVHRRVGLLEDALDTRLFVRQSRGYRLTSAGEELVASAETIEAEVLSSQNRLLGRDASLAGVVRIAAAEDVATYLLADILAELRREHAAIELEVVVGNERLSLSRREADVAVRAGSSPDDENVVARHVCSLGVALYASEGYLAARGRPRRISDVAEHAIVSGDDSVPLLKTVMDDLAPEAREVYRSNSVAHLAAAASRGLGVAGLPCFVGERVSGLVRLFKKPLPMNPPLWVMVHPDVRRAARVRTVVDHLHACLYGRRRLLEGKT